MNVLLHRHCAKYIYVLPDGIRELMSDISREVLRSQPEQMYTFIADYLDALMITRENARVAARLVECITEISITIIELLTRTGITKDDANKAAAIIQVAFRRHLELKREFQLKQLNITKDEEEEFFTNQIIDQCNISPEKADEAARIIQDAYRRFRQHERLEQDLLLGMIDWRVAARSAIYLYRKTGVSMYEADRAATLIKAAYKGYYTRQVMRRLVDEGHEAFNMEVKKGRDDVMNNITEGEEEEEEEEEGGEEEEFTVADSDIPGGYVMDGMEIANGILDNILHSFEPEEHSVEEVSEMYTNATDIIDESPTVDNNINDNVEIEDTQDIDEPQDDQNDQDVNEDTEVPEQFQEIAADGVPEQFEEIAADGVPEQFEEIAADGVPEQFEEIAADDVPEQFQEIAADGVEEAKITDEAEILSNNPEEETFKNSAAVDMEVKSTASSKKEDTSSKIGDTTDEPRTDTETTEKSGFTDAIEEGFLTETTD